MNALDAVLARVHNHELLRLNLIIKRPIDQDEVVAEVVELQNPWFPLDLTMDFVHIDLHINTSDQHQLPMHRLTGPTPLRGIACKERAAPTRTGSGMHEGRPSPGRTACSRFGWWTGPPV